MALSHFPEYPCRKEDVEIFLEASGLLPGLGNPPGAPFRDLAAGIRSWQDRVGRGIHLAITRRTALADRGLALEMHISAAREEISSQSAEDDLAAKAVRTAAKRRLRKANSELLAVRHELDKLEEVLQRAIQKGDLNEVDFRRIRSIIPDYQSIYRRYWQEEPLGKNGRPPEYDAAEFCHYATILATELKISLPMFVVGLLCVHYGLMDFSQDKECLTDRVRKLISTRKRRQKTAA
jgi:hypothetical protein